ncbi:hypothetical protein C8R46DRAFT_1208231 [Mycena filopes]|nr:hypothetical protein C8R46DRAFT_1208231 [Mycena filopes]
MDSPSLSTEVTTKLHCVDTDYQTKCVRIWSAELRTNTAGSYPSDFQLTLEHEGKLLPGGQHFMHFKERDKPEGFLGLLGRIRVQRESRDSNWARFYDPFAQTWGRIGGRPVSPEDEKCPNFIVDTKNPGRGISYPIMKQGQFTQKLTKVGSVYQALEAGVITILIMSDPDNALPCVLAVIGWLNTDFTIPATEFMRSLGTHATARESRDIVRFRLGSPLHTWETIDPHTDYLHVQSEPGPTNRVTDCMSISYRQPETGGFVQRREWSTVLADHLGCPCYISNWKIPLHENIKLCCTDDKDQIDVVFDVGINDEIRIPQIIIADRA